MFTDVVGSTRLWQEHADDMAESLAIHDRVFREAIAAHDGYVFSTAGDAFAAAFARASDGVAAAVDAQRALGSATWPGDVRLTVRIGFHTGTAVERDGDYFGPTLNLAARVMSVAHGGQIVATEATARLLDSGGSDVAVRPLGEHALRDIDGLVGVRQVTAPGLATEFPALQSSSAGVALPSHRSRFIGRGRDIAEAVAALDQNRLVTLTGAGGCGKTRLAVEVASRVAHRFPDGTRFVDLARIADDAEVAESFAQAIDFVPDPSSPVGTQVRERLGAKSVLLVVDNCEHVIDEVADQVDLLLDRCPNVRVLATSREPVDVDGERVMRVPPLDLDDEHGRSAASQLFLERMAELGVAVDDTDDTTIAAICSRLDGLPLAIELAAARTSVMTPAQILGRLDDRFALLTGGRRRTRGRQQTLEATIAWSYDLLDDDERDALGRISVMPAAFDIEMAAAVLDRPTYTAVDLLDGLVARSLLQSAREDDTVRFRLLETVRSYAYERLIESDGAPNARDRHARHVLRRLDEVAIQPVSMRPGHRPIADDVLAAVDWAHARGDRALAAGLLSGGFPIYVARGAHERCLDVARWASEADDPVVSGEALSILAVIAMVAAVDDPHPARSAAAALEAAGDRRVPWRAKARSVLTIYRSTDPVAVAEQGKLTRDAVADGQGPPSYDMASLAMEVAGALWGGDAPRVEHRDRLARVSPDDDLDPIAFMNVLCARLLAPMLADDSARLEHEVGAPSLAATRRSFLDAAARGEHWQLSYEASRGAALASLGRIVDARRDLADALALTGTHRMPGIDADFLGAYAWVCVCAGEADRAAELLDDTWFITRSPTTLPIPTAAQDRALGREPDRAHRTAELFRRRGIRHVIRDEDRTRRALDSELTRLGLVP